MPTQEIQEEPLCFPEIKEKGRAKTRWSSHLRDKQSPTIVWPLFFAGEETSKHSTSVRISEKS